MSTSVGCKDGASKSNDNVVCEVNEKLQNMSTADMSTHDVSVCANCGKEGNSNEISNMCNKCKQVKYCNAACKKQHRHKHKKQCEEYVSLAAQRVAELHDEELFKQPPPAEDCPICFQRLPIVTHLLRGSRYMTCCGKTICSGCMCAPVYDNQGNEVAGKKCPFCRTPAPTTENETIKREKKRVELNDPFAIYNFGVRYFNPQGFAQDYTKALELWHRAGELGYAKAYNNIGCAYEKGEGVKLDKKRAIHHYELAAMGGDAHARYNLGFLEKYEGNVGRALKHFMISTRDGYTDSLEQIKQAYLTGHATKECYTKALQVYQEYLGEIKSIQRDKAAAISEHYRYY